MRPRTHFLLALLLTGAVTASAAVLEKGDRVAITGDSITEQKLYSKYVETYLLACRPDLDLRVIQLGWSGERAPGFERRMENDLMFWKPDIVTTCYGMNDGRYRAYEYAIGETYAAAMRAIVTRLKEAGATVVVGSPGVVDSYTYDKRRPNAAAKAAVYNENLAALAGIARDLAAEFHMPYADVNGVMAEAMAKAKAVHGADYHVAGSDGVHPRENGHLVMAYAFLKAMGLDGDIGTIEVDWGKKAVASAGHTVTSVVGGAVTVNSSRYPFCFTGDAASPESTVSILSSAPFQQDLNRLVLSVTNLPGSRAEVRWGPAKKTFTRDQLASGINLASEFLQNPFSEPFGAVLEAVGEKQRFETFMIKRTINRFPSIRENLPDDSDIEQALDTIHGKLTDRQQALDAAARAAVVPITHTITVTPLD